MLTRFFTPQEVTDYFERNNLNSDLLNDEMMAICSIADLLDICEAYKKDNLDIRYLELQERFETFNRELVDAGKVFIADLDQDNLSKALFERDDYTTIDLWYKAANRNISPKRSIRYLTLRITDEAIWWSENVYQEMEDYHATQDE